jgi:hypothetical protein
MGNRWKITELEVVVVHVVVVVVWWRLMLWWWCMGVTYVTSSYVTSSEASGWQSTNHSVYM